MDQHHSGNWLYKQSSCVLSLILLRHLEAATPHPLSVLGVFCEINKVHSFPVKWLCLIWFSQYSPAVPYSLLSFLSTLNLGSSLIKVSRMDEVNVTVTVLLRAVAI